MERHESGSAALNGDHEGEFWKVFDTAGTVYTLGRGFVDTEGQSRRATNSTWTVPVFGDDVGDPCYASVLENAWCTQAWRWNLDRVQDLPGNVINYFYVKETNKYDRMGVVDASYVRGGYLSRVEYGTATTSGGVDQAATSRVVFSWEDRCTQRATGQVDGSGKTCVAFTKAYAKYYPDVPMDLICSSGCTEGAPTFFSQKLLRSVTSQRWNGASFAWVDRVNLGYGFPLHEDGTSPGLWLSRIQKVGYSASGNTAVPTITTHGAQFDNRVDHNAAQGVPRLSKYRVVGITDELGARTDVTYGQPPGASCTGAHPSAFDTNGKACFPRYWKPDGAPGGFGLFHKYVTLAVSVDNRLPGGTVGGGEPSVDHLTRYTYSGSAAWAQDNEPVKVTPLTVQSYAGWRGYRDVRVDTLLDGVYRGSGSGRIIEATDYRFFRGMYGTKLSNGSTRTDSIPGFISGSTPDRAWLAGQVAEQRSREVSATGVVGPELSGTAYTYGVARTVPAVTGQSDPFNDASLVVTSAVRERTRVVSEAGTASTQTKRMEYEHDAYGRVTSASRAGAVVPACVRTEYAAGAAARELNKLDYVGRVYEYTSSCAGSGTLVGDTRYFYDGSTSSAATQAIPGGLVTRVDERASSSKVITTRTGYDSYGRVTSATDGLGKVTTTSYSPVTAATQSMSVTNPAGHVTSTLLDSRRLIPVQITDPNGNVTRVGADDLGRTSWVAQPGHTSSSPTTRFTYLLDEDKTLPPQVNTATRRVDGTYETSSEFFDSHGQLLQAQRAPGDGSSTVVFVNTRYDERGNTEAVSQPVVSAGTVGAGMIAVPTSAVSETRWRYDGLSRPLREGFYASNALLWESTSAYHGTRTVTTPPAGGVATTVVTDLLGRVTSRTEGVAGTGPGLATTSYSYDVSDNLITVTDPAGKTTTNNYDWLGRRTSITDPAAGTVTTSYDNNHQPVTTTRASGSSLTRTYDTLGRVTKVTGKATSVATAQTLQTSTFDTATRGKGLPATVTTHTAAGTYKTATTAYTNRGAPSNATYTVPTPGTGTPVNYTYTYTYDSLGRLATTGLPAVAQLSAETLTHGYTPTGAPATLTGTREYVSATDYRADHLLAKRTIGSTTTEAFLDTAYTWDPQTQRLASVRTVSGLTEQQMTLRRVVSNDQYDFDPAGNLTSVTDVHPSTDIRTCHTYDTLNRLTHSWTTTATACADSDTQAAGTGGYNTKWGYTTAGDITSTTRESQTTNYTYGSSAPAHAVTKTTTGSASTSYTYTPNGQQDTKATTGGASPGTTSYEWDLTGNLATATTTGTDPGTTTLAHALDGTRLARTTSSGTTTIYLPDVEITYPASGNPTAVRYYTHDGNTVAIRRSNYTLTWQTSDRQGSAFVQLGDGTISATRLRYDPYGQPQSGTPVTDRSWLDKTTDQTTGLTHLGHRYYDTTLGRFLTPDPLVDQSTTQTSNPYSYGAGNPTHYTDPDGLLPRKPWLDDGRNPPKAKPKYTPPANPIKSLQPLDDFIKARANPAYKRSSNQSGLLGAPQQTASVGGPAPLPQERGLSFWLGELSGWNDVQACFSGQSLGSCGWTAVAWFPAGKLAKGLKVTSTAAKPAAKTESTFVRNVLRDERGSVRLGGLGDGGIKGATGSVGKIADQFGYSTRQIRTAIHDVKRGSAFPGNPDVVIDRAGEVYPVGRDGAAGDSIGNILDSLGGNR